MTFLEETIADIFQKVNVNEKVAIIIPNKRTGLFLKKYYGIHMGKTVWSPDIYTIDTLIKKLTGLKTPDKLSLLFDLYKTTIEVFSESESENEIKNYTFDKFFPFGEILLSDLNELDNYLIDTNLLFRNIVDLAEIEDKFDYLTPEQITALQEFWQNFSTEYKSKEKQRFIELWRKIPVIASKFSENLLLRRKGYSGLVNRQMIKMINNSTINHKFADKFIFVGFNALTKTDKKLFAYLQSIKKALFYWDFDDYYIKQQKQEAGFFMRDNLLNFPDSRTKKQTNLILNIPREINLIGVPLEVGQAKALPTLLENMQIDITNDNEPEKTAIILADEHLLFPVLHSLPAELEKINVTMGYPLTDTALYSLIENYLRLQHSARNTKSKKIRYYYKDVISILQHPEIHSKYTELCNQIILHIETANKVFTEPDYFLTYKNKLIDALFTPILNKDGGVDLLTTILNILFMLFDTRRNDEGEHIESVENEYIYQAYLQIKRLREILKHETQDNGFNIDITSRLLRQMLQNIRIPFSGEPLNGLQVIGFMETRNIDFDNIIILSMNEGILPTTSHAPTFISQNLRLAFGLPVIKYQDSIFAYLFYRLLQRSKQITILYNNITGYGNSGELSRFVQQLLFESGLKITHRQFKQDLIPVSNKTIKIEKNADILQRLTPYIIYSGKSEKQLSASAINTYIDCSLQFYFKYIAQIPEQEEIQEEINQLMFGNILHHCIEIIYKNITTKNNSKLIQRNDIEAVFANIDYFIEMAFIHEFESDTKKKFEFSGTNLILKEVIKKYLESILTFDIKCTPFEVLDIEDKYGYINSLDLGDKKIAFRAVIDRIDKIDNSFRIVDYKTGSVDKNFKSLENLFDSENEQRNKVVLQMLFYNWMFNKKTKTNNSFPAIYNVREMHGNAFSANIVLKDGREQTPLDPDIVNNLLIEFEELLKNKISEIFDSQICFTQTQNDRICSYCTFKVICNK